MVSARLACKVITCLLLIEIMGCGGGGGVKSIANCVPCHGTVTFNGKPLEQGTVSFVPVNAASEQPATGIVRNGSFKMTTTISAPGVVIGTYKVIVESHKPVEFQPGRNIASGPAVSLIPTKYSSVATSGFEVNVKKGMAAVKLELKND